MYIEVILNNKVKILNRTFDYIVPEHMKEGIHIGSRVLVPFGRSTKDAYVIGFKDKSDFECKEILEVLTTEEISEENNEEENPYAELTEEDLVKSLKTAQQLVELVEERWRQTKSEFKLTQEQTHAIFTYNKVHRKPNKKTQTIHMIHTIPLIPSQQKK